MQQFVIREPKIADFSLEKIIMSGDAGLLSGPNDNDASNEYVEALHVLYNTAQNTSSVSPSLEIAALITACPAQVEQRIQEWELHFLNYGSMCPEIHLQNDDSGELILLVQTIKYWMLPQRLLESYFEYVRTAKRLIFSHFDRVNSICTQFSILTAESMLV
jgi:hypothetical protein